MTEARAVVAIVGGGFTGATVAYHLAGHLEDQAVDLVIIEPREGLGQGLAYSTTDPSHRINVPANRMTMDCAVEDGFQRWLDDRAVDLSPGSRTADGSVYAQRGLVAAYVADRVQPYLSAGRIRHIRARAVAVEKGDRFRIGLDDGSEIAADQLVVATSHPPPSIPEAFAHLKTSPRLIADPADRDRLAALAKTAGRIAIIGTGLTSADVIASLDRQGYPGEILALSRRGLRSRGHALGCPESAADFANDPETTALGVLRRIRAAVRQDRCVGFPGRQRSTGCESRAG